MATTPFGKQIVSVEMDRQKTLKWKDINF